MSVTSETCGCGSKNVKYLEVDDDFNCQECGEVWMAISRPFVCVYCGENITSPEVYESVNDDCFHGKKKLTCL